jgi:ferredoxin-NADP reductase
VSPYLVDEARPGDALELRGPIGGYFAWHPAVGGPLTLVAGGSGVVPLAAMVRVRARVPARLLCSARSPDDAIFRSELDEIATADPSFGLTYTFTREPPDGWTGYRRRVDAEMLSELAWPGDRRPLAFVCGPTAFVELVSALLVDLDYEAARVRTERFGPTGGTT